MDGVFQQPFSHTSLLSYKGVSGRFLQIGDVMALPE